MIRIEGLTILFESFKIKDLEISIREEEFHSLLGPTGCGKTLILESIMGLHKPKKGKIWIGQKEIQGLTPERREISYVPQDLALFPHLKVMENIFYGIRAKHLDETIHREYVQCLIQEMKVEHLLDRYPGNLSGGEKKRVALLRALAPRPKLLLLDEPLSGLDPSIKAEIQELLKRLHSQFRPTVLCVTHDFEEAYFLSDRITIFMDGKIEQVGGREDIFFRPASRKVAQFLGAKNLYSAVLLQKDEPPQRFILGVKGLRFSVPQKPQEASPEVGQEVGLFIRPEEVMIIREGKPIKESLQRNMFLGKIIQITGQRTEHLIEVQTLEGGMMLKISIPNYAFRNLGLSVGKVYQVALREESLWVLS